MSLKYDFFAVNELNNTQGKYRARAVSQGKISTRMLTRWMSQTNGISTAQATGFIEILTDALIYYVENGYEVEVGKLGFFSASVTSKLVDDPREIRAESICLNRLNFRAGIEVKKKLESAGIERVQKPRYKNKVRDTTRNQRGEMLKKYLAEKPLISRSDYSELTGMMCKPTAVKDLNVFIEEGWLEKYGSGYMVVYMLKREE